jgi:hypothetical protein
MLQQMYAAPFTSCILEKCVRIVGVRRRSHRQPWLVLSPPASLLPLLLLLLLLLPRLQVPEHHARMGAKISDYDGNVPSEPGARGVRGGGWGLGAVQGTGPGMGQLQLSCRWPNREEGLG